MVGAHKWSVMPHVLILFSPISVCTPIRGVISWFLVLERPSDITTPCTPHIYPSFLLSFCLIDGETSPEPPTSPLPSSNFNCRTASPTFSLTLHHPMGAHHFSCLRQHPQNHSPTSQHCDLRVQCRMEPVPNFDHYFSSFQLFEPCDSLFH